MYLDGILGQHGAVQLHRRQLEEPRNVLVLDGEHLVDRLALDPLGGDLKEEEEEEVVVVEEER